MKKIKAQLFFATILLYGILFSVHAQTTYFRVIGGIPHLPVVASTAVVSSPSSGTIVYSTADSKPQLYNGSTWVDLCTGSTFTANAGYFKVVGGLPIFPVKAAGTSTTSGAMYINTSSTLKVYASGSWQSARCLTGSLAGTTGSAYGAELLAPVLSSAPAPMGLSAGAFYINSATQLFTWYNGSTWVGLNCTCYAYTNAAHTSSITFQCHNLGANTALNPYTYVSSGDAVDNDIKGYLYQWGRGSDGHQLRSSTAVSGTSSSDSPGNGNFLYGSGDWRSPQNDALWGATKTANDPCPAGYRVPTYGEWSSILSPNNTWRWTNSGYLINDALFLPAAGCRKSENGSLFYYLVGNAGYYWSSTVNGAYPYSLRFGNVMSGMYVDYRTFGFSVRCVKDAPVPDINVYTNAAHTSTITFQAYNLGANTTLDPYTYVSNGDAVDYDIKGYLYQWGRGSDGHQLRSSTAVSGTSLSDSPRNGNFLTGGSGDWRSPQNDALWGATKTANDPCPVGYRVPTQGEWSSILSPNNTWTWTNSGYKINDALFLPAAGKRDGSTGSFYGAGSAGWYWSSLVNGTRVYNLSLSTGLAGMYTNDRSNGFSVRCVKDTPVPDVNVYTNAAHTSIITFQAYNLGANTTLDPYTYVSNGDAIDYDIKGYLYQWGRGSDGHQLRSSTIVLGTSSSDSPGNGNFLYGSDDWRSPQNDGLWGATKTANDPCPAGYRVPTQGEWSSILSPNNTWTWTNSGYKINDALFLPAAGARQKENGLFYHTGVEGLYWSSTVNGTGAYYMRLGSGSTNLVSALRSSGLSVRCMKYDPLDVSVYTNAAHTSTITFQAYNLGANTTLDPFTYVDNGDAVDYDIKGYLYQWGRGSDGHQLRSSTAVIGYSESDSPGNSNFLYDDAWDSELDWRMPHNDALWGATKTANDPCPGGYRVPTRGEWSSILSPNNTWSWTNGGYKINDALFLPLTGFRDLDGGMIQHRDYGCYWSSTNEAGANATALLFSNSNDILMVSSLRMRGLSVRCMRYALPDVNVYTNAAHTSTITFQAYNLGANTTLDPYTYVSGGDAVDYDIKGYLYQWGRGSDGHQLRSSTAVSGTSTSNRPGNGNFLYESDDWRSPQNDALWGATKTANDPCPAGYRVPTQGEWSSILSPNNTWTWTNSGYKINDTLFLPAAGVRMKDDGSFYSTGNEGLYWSSTVNGTGADYLRISISGLSVTSCARSYGLSVRCVKE